MSRGFWAGRHGGGRQYPDDGGNWTYKGVQISLNPTLTPTVSELEAANVGAVRWIQHDGEGNGNSEAQAIAAFEDEGQLARDVWGSTDQIYPIACHEMPAGMSQAMWERDCRNWVRNVPAGVFELGNERGRQFDYAGGGGTQWSKYFLAVEHGAAVVHQEGGKCILGAAVDIDTNAMLTQAKNRWGTSAANWPVDGVAVHPYGHSSAHWDRDFALTQTENWVEGARSRIPAALPIWVTEVGYGAGGNTRSTLVANQDTVWTKVRSAFTIPTNGSTFTVPVDETAPAPRPGQDPSPTPFTGSGRLMLRDNPTDHIQLIDYTNINSNTFLGCTLIDGDGGSVIVGEEVTQHYLPNGARETEQAASIGGIFGAGRLWDRNGKTNLHPGGPNLYVRNIGIFLWQDYVGHFVPPTGPVTWAEYAGLHRGANNGGMGADGSARPALTTYTNVRGGARRKAI
jgi:hypothetical protein